MERVGLSGRREPDRTFVRIGGAFEFPRTLEDVRGLKRASRGVLARFLCGVERVEVEGTPRERVDDDVPEVLVVMTGHAALPRLGEQVFDREEPAEVHRRPVVRRSVYDRGRGLIERDLKGLP